MSAQHQLRLPAALTASAAIHAVVLALVLRAATSGGLFVDAPQGPPKAELIKVSLISKPGGGGGGALPGMPSAPRGEPGAGAPEPPALPNVRLETAPPPVPQVAAAPKPAPVAPRLPSPVRFPTIAARDVAKPPVPGPKVAAAPPVVPPAAPADGATAGGQVASLGGETGHGGGGGTGTGQGGGGEGTGTGSGGDGSDGLARPAYGSNPKPPYPLAARRLGVEGVVMLEVLVRPDGSPAEVHIRTSSGSPLLDDSALETVRSRWRFIPARRGNAAVESRVTFPIRFRLDAS
jgi:periplasmic protein TonB